MQFGEAFMTGAAGQKRVPTKFIEDFLIGVPNIKEQKLIISFIENNLNKINNTIDKITKEIQLLTEYKSSLIYEVVTGKVKVDSLVEEPLEAAV